MIRLDKKFQIGKPSALGCLLVALSISFISACTKAPSTINESFDLGNDGGYLTDAKARVIISQNPSSASRPGAIYPRRITCVEPHPDVASTVANSFGVGLSIFASRTGSLSVTEVEGLAQIAQRTVSIQTLQRLMFRACEAYANGAITGTGYSLLLSEINKTMVTLILAETAGARFGQAGAVLGGTSSALASAEFEELMNLLKELEASQNEVSDATSTLGMSAEKAATAASVATEDDQVTTAEAEAVKDANQNVKQDNENLEDKVERLKRKSAAVTQASSRISKAEGLGSLNVTPNPEVAAILASMQQNFLSEGKTQNYISACLVELGMGSEPNTPSLDMLLKDPIAKLPDLLEKLKKFDEELKMLDEQKTELSDSIEPLQLEIAQANGEKGESLKNKKREITDTEKMITDTEKMITDTEKMITDVFTYLSNSNLVGVQSAARKAIDNLAMNDKIELGDLQAFVYRIYHLNRKTGLYSHCLDNLASELNQVHDLQEKELEHNVVLKKKMVDAAVVIANSKGDSDVAKFAICHLLPDVQRRLECIANLKKFTQSAKKKPAPPKPSAPAENQPKRIETGDLPKTISIAQQDLIGLKATLPELVMQLAKLDAFKGDKIQVPTQINTEELEDAIKKHFYELVKSQEDLKKALLEISRSGHLIHSTIEKHLSKAPSELEEIFALYNNAVAEHARADDKTQKLLDVKTKPYVLFTDATRLLTKLRIIELEITINMVTELITKIEQHNADVAAFKPS